MKNLRCRFFNHKWQMDRPLLPSSRTCKRCGKEQKIHIVTKSAFTITEVSWEDVPVRDTLDDLSFTSNPRNN
ncbi:MAG: hypothetical protein EOO14_00660 [Chitinophagaceae bacterium]|nr:MAG: hypothetical protein EOO14_00660 [Chitinophagaceae bacterium]